MFWVTVIFLPLIGVYTSWVYYKLRGKVSLETLREDY
jgi:cytochrome bd-type quinol oxidase subunit 2